ncbi:MAG: hypothetical protein CAF45_008160 [Nitrospira sp. CG24E]|nr:MAG: hypothetical protein CAF45_008160 [Nitrospira sp. CG24E]
MAADTTDDFQKELVDLFIEEAHEWLQNIHVALDELQQGPAPERHEQLIETMLAGVTNLGVSADTINLPTIKDASFAAVPFVEALKDPLKAFSVQDFFALCRQLGQIQTALTGATGFSLEGDGGGEREEIEYEGLSPSEFLQALRELQKIQLPTAPSGCNYFRSLIEQIEGQVQAGVERIDVTAIQGYLAQVSEAEESFLKAIDERVPEISKKMSVLETDERDVSSRMKVLEVILQDVASLRTEAQQANAGSAMMFFTGLHSLLAVVAQRHVLLASTRVESVKARLYAMGDAIRQWVEQGRVQRAAIDQLFPASHS